MRTEDGSIICRCLNGEPEAFGLLVDKYKAGIYAFVYVKLRNFQDAQDVTQEVFMNAYRNLRTLRQWESFVFWLYRIASNISGKWILARSRRPDSEFIEDQSQDVLGDSSIYTYRRDRLDESLREVLNSLPEIYREVLTLYYFGGMSSVDIARALGKSPATIRKRLSRARTQLKQEMIAVMGNALEGQRLQADFTFRIVEAVRRMKIHPMPRVTGLPWGLSLATGIILAILTIGSHVSLPNLIDIHKSSELSGEAAAEIGETPVDVLEIARMPIISGHQGNSSGGTEIPTHQNAILTAPHGKGDEWPEKATARLGRGAVQQVAYSPDGELLAVAAASGVWLLDADNLDGPGLLAGHADGILSVAFSPDGRLLASGSADGKVHLWNVPEQKEVESLSLQGDAGANVGGVEAVVFSPDGKTLAAKSGGAAYLWDVGKREQVGVLQGEAGWLYCLAFSPDSKLLALGGVDRAVSLWDVERQEQVGLLEGHTTAVWDVNRQKQIGIAQGHMTPVFSIAFSPDGRLLASASFETTVRLWDMEERKQVGMLGTIGKMKNAILVAFYPDGKTLASTSSKGGTIHLWNVEEQKQVGKLKGDTQVYSMALNPDGRTLASAAMDGTIRLWDTEAQKQLHSLQHAGAVYSLSFSPDSKTLASGGDDRMVRLWDVDGQKEIGALEGHTGRLRPVAFSPDGKLLASGDRDKPWTVCLWDVEAQEQIGSLQGHKSVVWGVAFSPDGELLASGSLDGTARLWDVKRKELAGELRHPKGAWVRAVAFSPDGKLLASGCWDDTVYLWDVEKRKQVGMLRGHTDNVYSVAFSPDGKLMASGSANGAIRLWDVEKRQQVALLKGHKGEVMCVAFSPGGKLLASVSRDTEVSLWDVAEQKRVALLEGHSDRGKCVAFSPDGKWLASGSADGTILLWEVSLSVPGRLVEPVGKRPGI